MQENIEIIKYHDNFENKYRIHIMIVYIKKFGSNTDTD